MPFSPVCSLTPGRRWPTPAELLFPPRCCLCRELTPPGVLVCPHCQDDLALAPQAPFSAPFLSRCYAPVLYVEPFRGAFHRFKFQGMTSYAPLFGRWMADLLRDQGDTDFDLVTFVPISPLRHLRRGYNQARLLARAVAKDLSLPLAPTLRKAERKPLSQLSADPAARRARILGAFSPRRGCSLAGARVLLVDDLFTTGSTASECARTLLAAGASDVTCVTLARTPPKGRSPSV